MVLIYDILYLWRGHKMELQEIKCLSSHFISSKPGICKSAKGLFFALGETQKEKQKTTI